MRQSELADIADVFLMCTIGRFMCDAMIRLHFARIIDGEVSLVRRSRGYAPEPIGLPMDCGQTILAVGGQLKGTFAFGHERRGNCQPYHLGDLDHFQAFTAFEREILSSIRTFFRFGRRRLRTICIPTTHRRNTR